MSRLPWLAQKLLNRPLALHPAKAEIVIAAMADRMGVTHLFSGGHAMALASSTALVAPEEDDAFDVAAGVAVLPIHGTLVQKLGTVRPASGMSGYDGIRTCFLAAVHDASVKAIVLDVDSPGGECAGLFDLADTIYSCRGIKPIWAMLNEDAFSAAYALASAADRLTVPRTGGTGSVGVIQMHADMTKALAREGVTVTLVRYGERKARGNSYEALDEQSRGELQTDVDAMGALFAETVARNRGMTVEAVQETQAATYLGADGVRVGFADAVMAPDEAFQELLEQLA